MKKELKFKVWLDHTQYMTNAMTLPQLLTTFDHSERCIYLQSTGVNDKMGVAIFEGDIIKQDLDYFISYDQEWFNGHQIGEIIIHSRDGTCLKRPSIIDYNSDSNIYIKCKYNKKIASYRAQIIGNI